MPGRCGHCQHCPVHDYCREGLASVVLEISQRKKNSTPVSIALSLIATFQNDKVLLVPPEDDVQPLMPGSWVLGREDTTGLHHGLWSLPTTPWYLENRDIMSAMEKPEFVVNWLKTQGIKEGQCLAGVSVTR